MSLDKETITHIEAQAVALSAKIPEIDYPAMLVPDNVNLRSVERFQEQPYRHTGRFTTARIQSFIDYVKAHQESRTQLFVDDKGMTAQAAFDHFDANADADIQATGWREHIATISMHETPEWTALRSHSRNNGNQFTQREFLDFISDWSHVLTFKEDGGSYTNIPIGNVYQAVQKLEIKATSTATHEEKDFRASRSKMEELDVKGADSQLPASMHMACPTHIGLETTVVECRLMVLASEKNVALGYRINALDKIMDESAKDFADQIQKGVGELPLWMGSFKR